jgi:hypothetical protein
MHIDLNPVLGLLNSDHLAIEGSLEFPAPTLWHIPPACVIRTWKRVNVSDFKDALRSSPWKLMDSAKSVDDCCKLLMFYDLLDAAMVDSIPTTKIGDLDSRTGIVKILFLHIRINVEHIGRGNVHTYIMNKQRLSN